jgi:glycosyltransferase involved in cell wall biosynthesis
VVTNLGSALSYELNDGEQGLLCSFDDVRGLAELILELLNNTSLRRRLGAGGQSMVLQRFSQAACLQDFDDLLTRLTRVSNS